MTPTPELLDTEVAHLDELLDLACHRWDGLCGRMSEEDTSRVATGLLALSPLRRWLRWTGRAYVARELEHA